MSEILDQTVRNFFDGVGDVCDWTLAAQSVTTNLGSDEWQDTMTLGKFIQIMRSRKNPMGVMIRTDALAVTLREIEALPVTP